MMRPVLLCQGFHQAFIDRSSMLFSESAAMRRSVCETLIRHARHAGWIVVHSFLDTESVRAAGASSIQNFAPLPSEPYFRQKGLSAFSNPAFERMIAQHDMAPIFLASFAGIGVISATLLDAIARRFMLSVITDTAADSAQGGVSEYHRLAAIETLARACDSAVTCNDLMALAATPITSSPRHLLSQVRGGA